MGYSTQQIVQSWFALWTSGAYLDLPITDDFTHTSPFGTITGKQAYLDLVAANEDKFLGQTFEIHEEMHDENRAVAYCYIGDVKLELILANN